MGHAVVGGPRASAYCREAGSTARSVGAQLRVGATTGLFGVPAHELAGRHTALDDLWTDVPEVRDRLADAGTLDALLDCFEALLAAHVGAVDTLPPAVSCALGRLAAGARSAASCRRSAAVTAASSNSSARRSASRRRCTVASRASVGRCTSCTPAEIAPSPRSRRRPDMPISHTLSASSSR